VPVAALLAATTACAGSSADDADPSTATATATTALLGEALVVCSDVPYEPFEYGDPDDPEGFEVELVRAVGADLGRPVSFVPTPFDQIAAVVARGDCDLAASAIPVSDVTGELAFSTPYLDVDMAVLVRAADAAQITGVDALAGQPVGIVSDTPSADLFATVAPPGATTVGFVTVDDAIAALNDGTVTAVVADAPVVDHAVMDDDATTVVARVPTGTRYGFGLAPADTALLAQVNGALAALTTDGTLTALTEDWFGTTG
jgi:ABC-type amino acid transport substrate-binding protein